MPGALASSCNPATWRQVLLDGLREGLLVAVHVDPASALMPASTWTSLGRQGGSGCLRRGGMGQRGNPYIFGIITLLGMYFFNKEK